MSRTKKEAKDYEVGYGRPPRHGMFKPGRSGNPRGRPRAQAQPLDLGRMLADILASQVAVTENGQKRYFSRLEFLLLRLVNAAAQGDSRAFSNFLRLLAAFPLPASEKDHRGTVIDYGAQVRAKIEQMAKNLEESRKLGADTPEREPTDGPDEPKEP